MTQKIQLPSWARRFAVPARYKTAYGGRGSSKTWSFAHLLIARCANESLRVMCCRQYQTSISVSAKPALQVAIQRMGLRDHFSVQANSIVGLKNESLIMFKGIEADPEQIRGWESVDIVWTEEAQTLTHRSARIMVPTIRKPGSELWFTWNPKNRTDWVWERFLANSRPKDLIQKVNWYDNPWFPDEATEERLDDYKNIPELYAHIWEGEPDDAGSERKVIPFDLLAGCVEAFRRDLHRKATRGWPEIGLDVADTGTDFNALVTRDGPILYHAEKWHAPTLGDTARRADHYARENAVERVYYDAAGVGAAVRSYFADWDTRHYSVRPEQFGGAVKGGEASFSYRQKNKDFFARRNAQLGWALRLRAMNTRKLLDGEEVNVDQCLFIDPSIPRLEEFMAQLSQPAWREGITGKVELMKRDENEKSPDLYDAAVLAFARDSESGLKLRW